PLGDWNTIPSGTLATLDGDEQPTSVVTSCGCVHALLGFASPPSASGPGPPNAKIAVSLNTITLSSITASATMSPPNGSTRIDSAADSSAAVSSRSACEQL